MKHLISKFESWRFRRSPGKYRPGIIARWLFDRCTADGWAFGPSTDIVFFGDSRIEQFQMLINSEPGWRAEGVGGSKARDWAAKAKSVLAGFVFGRRSRYALDDTGGNDSIAGLRAVDTVHNKKEIRADLQAMGLRYLCLGIVPLAPSSEKFVPDWRNTNALVRQINTRMAADCPDGFIDLEQTELVKDGAGNPEYFIPDGIHFNEKAWPVIRREVQNFLTAAQNRG